MNRWYISDTHFGHENIIRFCDRPFAHAGEMDEFIKTLWNETVKPEDHITHLGDVTMNRSNQQATPFIKLMRTLHGHKRLHLGNHDHFPIKTYIEAGFEKVYATWRDEQGLLFSHMPLHPTSIGSAKANIHGHIHQHDSPAPATWTGADGTLYVRPYVNISVEKTKYRPIHYDEIMKLVKEAKDDYFQEHPEEGSNSNG